MKTAELSINERIELLKKWFLGSGIQSEDGGFYAWQDVANKSNSYLYSEITGYAITTMCFLYNLTKDTIFIDRARRAAKWITQNAMHALGGVLTRSYIDKPDEHYSFAGGNIYSFDCAMVSFGMLKLYDVTRERDYLDCAQKIIDFLNVKMSKTSGLYYPVYDTKLNEPYEDTEKWSTQSGSFHSKIALSLCELSGICNDISYMGRAKKLIDASLENFCEGNRFITNTADGTSHLHPYSYTLEGMLFYIRCSRDDVYMDVIEKTFDWMIRLQGEDGGFPTQVSADAKRSVPYQRCDIQSQILRLSYYIESDIDREKLAGRVLEFQNIYGNYNGGFLFGVDKDASVKNHSNAWCSMFVLQALCLLSGKADKETVLGYLV